jgi:hypothetical protein
VSASDRGRDLAAGFPREADAVIEAYKKDIDRTLIRENLERTPTERFEQLMKLQEFADELRRAGQHAKGR